MLCHDPQRLTDRSPNAVIDLSGPLTAATFQFATQLALVIRPLCDRRARHARRLGRLAMCRSGEKRVDGDELGVRQSGRSGLVGIGHEWLRLPRTSEPDGLSETLAANSSSMRHLFRAEAGGDAVDGLVGHELTAENLFDAEQAVVF